MEFDSRMEAADQIVEQNVYPTNISQQKILSDTNANLFYEAQQLDPHQMGDNTSIIGLDEIELTS